ncbi:hypothetical protein EX461_23945 [Vibrio parahaemolyticus]|nr:hypothetical protein [Vibrio parahaemolyticus]EJG0013989.1 hypothetical protein [Vibrio parahaemolyticus]EJS9799240.1 hypothetical protein [Vibrio parahaemolyticus]
MVTKFAAYLACVISIVLSVLILSSMGSGYMAYMFGAVAVITEITKYNCFRYREKRFNKTICVLLTLLSVAASIGSLQNGLQSIRDDVGRYEQQLTVLKNQQQIVQKSIDKLIALEHVTKAMTLLPQLEDIRGKIEQLQQPELSASYGMVKTVSEVTGLSVSSVSNGLYIVIAIVLDLCAFTLMLQLERNDLRNVSEYKETSTNENVIREVLLSKTTVVQQELFIDEELLKALESGSVRPSVRAVMSYKGVGYNKAKSALEVLVDAEYLVKTDTGRYQLHNESNLVV